MKEKKKMKDNIIMAVSELEDGREHIHTKDHKPLKYDLTKKADLKILEDYYNLFIHERRWCYSKDLTFMGEAKGMPEGEKVMVKGIRYEPYDKNLHIPYRTFSIMQRRRR